MRYALSGSALLLLLLGTAAGAIEQESRARMTADLLVGADADAQAPRPSRKRLAAKLRLLDRMGAHAEHDTDSTDDPIQAWRDAAGLREPDYRGRVLGPAYRRGWIGPGKTASIAQQFLGGRKTTVAIAAASNQVLDLRIDDPTAGAVCRAEGRSCSWMPLYTQRYMINVRNPGREAVRFFLVVD